MSKVLIFGGTTEGREALSNYPDAVMCVTSSYAASLLPPGTDCRIGRLNADEMLSFMQTLQPDRVIDATHPYAAAVSANIRSCCLRLHVPLTRIERPAEPGAWRSLVVHVPDAAAAAAAAARSPGNVLLTTGSQTLSSFTAAVSRDRLYARVLPTVESLTRCTDAGLLPSHIIAMQGPFSAAFNDALYDLLQIQVMVTKDSGTAGGIEEKVLPALSKGIDVILIDRPDRN